MPGTRDNSAEGGILVAAHGTRNEQGLAECRQCTALLTERLPGVPIELAYLELAQPAIAQGIERLARAGVRRLLVAPLLLFAAGHAKRDIPREVAAAAAEHGMQFEQAAHLGCHPALLELSATRFREALRELPPVPPEETLAILVGRGSLDETAIAEMHQFSRLRHELTPCRQLETAFLAMAEPRLEHALAAVAKRAAARDAAEPAIRRVVVQPHLLFSGDLLTKCRQLVEQAAAQSPELEWIVAGHLEPAPHLLDAIVGRLEECQHGLVAAARPG